MNKKLSQSPNLKSPESGTIHLTVSHIKDIAESRKDIEKGIYIGHSLLNKEAKEWLKWR